jgi:hypothetical protein
MPVSLPSTDASFVAVVLFVVVEVVLTIFFIYSSFPLSIFFFQKSLLPVFSNSAFKRTLCGGKWSLYLTSPTGTNGRYGCCDAGTYMASPEFNPFAKANACQNCPSPGRNPNENARLNCVLTTCAVTNGSMVNGNDCVCGTGTCTVSTGLFCKLNYCATGPFGSNALPNGDGSSGNPSTGLRKVVSDWITGGAVRNTVLTTYGAIEDWDVSHITNFNYLFYSKNAGSPDISTWNTGAVITMEGSKFLSTDASFACGNCVVCCCNSCC